jgi:3-methyladenine DNA glycosylase AlkD
MIKRVSGSKEFFIRKACGWALRQHAKVYPHQVKAFIEQHELSGLTIREARRQLDKMNVR